MTMFPITLLLSLLVSLIALTNAITPAQIPYGGVAEGYFGNWLRAYDGGKRFSGQEVLCWT